MSFTTIHFDASDYCGTDFDARRVKLWATNNAEDETIHDPDGHVYIGSGNGTIAADGQASITVPVPEAGWNPITCQTTLHLDYPDRNSRARNGRETKTFGPFTVPEGSIAGLITNVALTSNVASLTTSAAHGLRVGYTVTVSGDSAPFNGEHVITEVTSTVTFKCVIVAANVASRAAAALFTSNDVQLNDLVEEQAVPPVYLSQVTAALDAKVTEAEAAATAAAASAASAQAIVTADLDTATAVLVPDPGTATGAALSATFVPGADSKGDGKNVKNLRRPTLVIDKMFPSAFHDHQIMWIDEVGKKAYSIGQDRRFRRSTWAAPNDAAMTFGARISSSPDGSSWAADGIFLRTAANALIMEQRDLGTTTNTVLVRSASGSDGGVWSTVLTLAGGARFLGPQSVCQDANTGYLYAVEYMTGAGLTVANIHRSTDDGVTWTAWKAMPRSETDVAGKIRHWHSCRYDSVSQRVYFMAGDTSADAGIYRVNAGGTDIEPVLLNSQVTGQPKPCARAVDIAFFPTHLVWPVDGEDPHVRRMARTQIGQPSPVTERIADLNSTGWWTQKAADDGSVWVCSTATESIGTENDLASHLYAISDNGAQVDEIGAVVMDGNTLGYASLSGLGGGNGGGDSFWLRAHNFQTFPNTTYSAFQMRAKVVWGAAPIIKPPQRPKEIIRESRNGQATLPISGSVTFAHSRAPFRAMRLQILNLGVKRTAGTGTVAVQIYNVTTSAALVTYTGGQSWRTDSLTDTTEVYDSILVTTGAQIEFRLVETGGVATADALGFVEFGWTF